LICNPNTNTYFSCLEDWSDEMQGAGNHKTCWYDNYKDRGLRVKLAIDENDVVAGMIQSRGPPITYEKLVKKIVKRVEKLPDVVQHA